MPEPNRISPLLDGFSVGNPISEHYGVVCCPAIKENTDKKYILKIISIPASQAQLDALLLAGAYKDPADAMDYYRRMGEEILQEAELLKKLSRLDGFLPYDGWQMEPITRRRLGYEIYLIGSYKRSLEKYLKKNAVTHLQALNLGLDLCAALAVSREAGYMYVALKPANIYMSDSMSYRIGDLGFLPLSSLRYASLPERCHSVYTPPELLDPMAQMNLTVDTYAVGMILYQLYNDGQLPVNGKNTDQEIPSPVNADYEMAEIIMKAIHSDPAQRWEDPREMGKALASYMQRNSVNDIPITPFIPLDVKPEDIVPVSKKEPVRDPESPGKLNSVETPEETVAEQVPEDTPAEPETVPQDTEESSLTDPPAQEESLAPADLAAEAPKEESPAAETMEADAVDSEIQQEEAPALPEQTPESVGSSTEVNVTDVVAESEISEEVAKILDRADDLIAHQIPEEAVFPEEPEVDPFSFVRDEDEAEYADIPEEPAEEQNLQEAGKKKRAKHFADPTEKNKAKAFFSRLVLILLLCAAGWGCFWYYQNVYLQTVDELVITGTQNEITVLIDTSVDESDLIVTCSDSFGKVHTGLVSGGKVTFSDLHASTLYNIEVDMHGLHKLTGKTTGIFTTEATTQILSFTAVGGAEDGSVILNFTVDGEEPDFWNIFYSAEGEETLRETVTGHSAMISGLTIGKRYTFTLDGGDKLDLGGETTLDLMASKLIMAEDIVITSENGSDITITWDTPGDVVVDSWNVRFYDGFGYEEQIQVTENLAVFTGLSPDSGYAVDITASGMTQPVKTSISADPINISAFEITEKNRSEMKISWDYTGSAPEGGWTLVYTIDGGGNQIVKCEKDFVEISPLIPGAEYRFTLHSADNRTIFNNVKVYTSAAAEAYNENGVKLENMKMDLLKTPEAEDWICDDLPAEAYTNTFAPGESISIGFRSSENFYTPGYKTSILYVYRNVYGNVLPDLICEDTCYWKNIWTRGDIKTGELTIPKTPTAPGDYVLELYFNGMAFGQFDLTIS